jgi:hypothetical protein
MYTKKIPKMGPSIFGNSGHNFMTNPSFLSELLKRHLEMPGRE